LASLGSVTVPLLAPLIPGGIRPGTMLLVEFDPESQWFSVATTIAARFYETKHHVGYLAMGRPPEEVKRSLTGLGVNVSDGEKTGLLAIEDWYSASLSGGRVEHAGKDRLFESTESGLRVLSLKVADLSVEWLKSSRSAPHPVYDIVDFWPAGSLIIVESFSSILRFNEEKAFVEWIESRVNPAERKRQSITIQGFVRGIHSDQLYKLMENASDGVIDIRVQERGEETKNVLRVRSLKGQPHDTKWHEIVIESNGEVTLAEQHAKN
jgi:KaiC/GvpD/RAD55 family RecA-like ATPase